MNAPVTAASSEGAGPPNRAALWFRWALVAVVVVATFEFAARVDDRISFGAPILGNYEMDQLFTLTPRGWRGVPNGQYVKWALNASGFRGPDIRPDRGQVRVVAYGASETFGIYEAPGQEFPRALERDLNEPAGVPEFEVINAGMPGMRVGSGISLLQDIAVALRPKVVLIYPTPTHYIGVTRPYCGRPVVMQDGEGERPTFRIAEKIKDRVKGSLPRSWLSALRSAGIAWTMRGRQPLDHVAPESLAAFETDLRCALSAVKESGAVPILVTHASRFASTPRPDDDYWLTGWRLQYPEMRQSGLLSLEAAANAQVRSTAAEEGVRLVDAAAALSGDEASFADHAHFTDIGAGKMARLLAPAVRDAAAAGPLPR